MQFQSSRCYQQSKGASLVDFVSAFIQSEEIDSDIIDSLEELLNKKRKDLN
ncbi:hypothetical protein SDC9_194953 [bioreactor metagenome]|uniref:Uncharacterized protein n=2 Tax=root TaxID=1 RepID=A0A645I7Q2_9ZZZZ